MGVKCVVSAKGNQVLDWAVPFFSKYFYEILTCGISAQKALHIVNTIYSDCMMILSEKYPQLKQSLISPFRCDGDLTLPATRNPNEVETLQTEFREELLNLPTLIES
jgi:hypothetical protein